MDKWCGRRPPAPPQPQPAYRHVAGADDEALSEANGRRQAEGRHRQHLARFQRAKAAGQGDEEGKAVDGESNDELQGREWDEGGASNPPSPARPATLSSTRSES